MQWDDIKHALEMPFPVSKIHWRVGSTNAKKLNCKPWEATKGIALAYVDARDVMKRLDDVMGPRWQCRYPILDSGLLICDVGLKINDEWIWRSNGAGDTQVEAEKGKASDAFKRAAVLWGIARYLYALPNKWVDLENGKIKTSPQLPPWATPEGYQNIIDGRK